MSAIYRSAEGERSVRERTAQWLAYWPVPSRQIRVPTREGETFVVACGDEAAPPLVLLHGSGATSVMWMGDVGAWSKQFRVYCVDMIGEPGLSAPSRPPLDSDAHALWLDDVMRGLAVERAAFVGISLGGWLALDYAIRRPQRAQCLALLCPGGVGRQRPSFLWKVLPLLLLGSWGRRKAMAIALGSSQGPTTPVEQAFGEYVMLIQSHFRPRREKLPVFSDAALRALTIPVLAIVGGRDALLDSRDTEARLRHAAPHAEVDLLPDVGHFVRNQNARILDFLARAQSSSA